MQYVMKYKGKNAYPGDYEDIVIRACTAQDVEDADDSTAVIPLTLSQARAGSAEMKTFFHANQGEHPELRKYMDAVEGIEKLLERMTYSARSKQTTLFRISG